MSEYTNKIESKMASLLSYCLDTDINDLVTSYEDAPNVIDAVYTFQCRKYKCNFSFSIAKDIDIDSVNDMAAIIYDCSLSVKYQPPEFKKPIKCSYTIGGLKYDTLNESIVKAMKQYEETVRHKIYDAKQNSNNDDDETPSKTADTDKLDIVISLLKDIKKLLQNM